MALPMLLLVALLCPIAPATLQGPAASDEAPPAAPPELVGDQVAWVEGEVITRDDYLRYLGTVYDRLPEGEAGMQQALAAAIIRFEARHRSLTAEEHQVEARPSVLSSTRWLPVVSQGGHPLWRNGVDISYPLC